MRGIYLLYITEIIIKHQYTPEKVLSKFNKDLIFFLFCFFLVRNFLHSLML